LHDEAMATRLWQRSEEITRDYLVSHYGADYNDFEKAIHERNKSD
jgi:hypothetical protein